MSEIIQSEVIVLPKKSMFSRIWGIFTEPKETFRYLDENPDVLIAIMITAVSALLISIAGSIQLPRNPDYVAQLEKIPSQGIAMMKYGVPIIQAIFIIIFSVLILLLQGGIIHVLAPFLNGKSTFKHLITVLGYASAPMLLFGLIYIVYVLINPDIYLPFTASLGLFYTAEDIGWLWYSLSSRFDLFVIWSAYLTVIGLTAIYKFTWKKSLAIVLAFWLIGTSFAVGGAKIGTLLKNTQPETGEVEESESE